MGIGIFEYSDSEEMMKIKIKLHELLHDYFIGYYFSEKNLYEFLKENFQIEKTESMDITLGFFKKEYGDYQNNSETKIIDEKNKHIKIECNYDLDLENKITKKYIDLFFEIANKNE